MLSYKIIILYIEWYLHYTLDYYIKHEYNIYIYTNLVFIWCPQRQVPSYIIATILSTIYIMPCHSCGKNWYYNGMLNLYEVILNVQ